MSDPFLLFVIIGTFFVAGTVKGVIGLGLPTVSLGILAVVIDLPTAMALLLVPSFATNLWQACVGGYGAAILRRIWPFLVMATAMVWFGSMALTRIDLAWLSGLLGGVLTAYAVLSLGGIRFEVTARQEVWVGPLVGTANGILTGMTGSFVVPGVMFLQGIGLSRDALIQAMGILFTLSTLALAVALRQNSFLTPDLGALSVAALAPAAVGMIFGRKIRERLSEGLFRRTFFLALLLLGGYIMINSAVDLG